MKLRLPASGQLRSEFQQQHYVLAASALPPMLLRAWRQKAQEISPSARLIERTDGELPLKYRVMTGEMIRDLWPELFTFYHDPGLRDWIRDVTGERQIITSPQLRSAVNLNIIEGTDSIYRWHFDAIPYTVLLYLNDVRPDDGAALELVPGCAPYSVPDRINARRVALWPTAGTLVLMDGTRCYHHVTPLLRPVTRFSIPLVYPSVDMQRERPDGLDAYLYEPAA